MGCITGISRIPPGPALVKLRGGVAVVLVRGDVGRPSIEVNKPKV